MTMKVLSLLQLTIIAMVTNRLAIMACPTPCTCSGTRVTCDRKSLTSIPSGIPVNTTYLGLSRNPLTSIPAGVFDKLTVLQTLYFRYTSLTSIPAGVFDKLAVLQTLNLGVNRLTSISAGVFDKLTVLQALVLNDNRLTSVHSQAFDNLAQLQVLYLYTNQLTSVPPGAFDKLTELKTLYLQNNQLTSVAPLAFDKLTQLTNLILLPNPLILKESLCGLQTAADRFPGALGHLATGFNQARDSVTCTSSTKLCYAAKHQSQHFFCECSQGQYYNGVECSNITSPLLTGQSAHDPVCYTTNSTTYICQCPFGQSLSSVGCERSNLTVASVTAISAAISWKSFTYDYNGSVYLHPTHNIHFQSLDISYNETFVIQSGQESFVHQSLCPNTSYIASIINSDFNILTFTTQFMADIKKCCSTPCQNGGRCMDQVNGFDCQCTAGYTGLMCQTDIDECASTPCQNDGSCVDQMNGFVCQCSAGYTGVMCQTDINECASTPCQNNGSCVDQVDEFVCQCSSGYTGVMCQTDINECSATPCQNRGRCLDQVNGFVCQCTAGYTGLLCQTDIDECASSPCQNNGSCMDGVNGHVCQCSAGYTGPVCQRSKIMDQFCVDSSTADERGTFTWNRTLSNTTAVAPCNLILNDSLTAVATRHCGIPGTPDWTWNSPDTTSCPFLSATTRQLQSLADDTQLVNLTEETILSTAILTANITANGSQLTATDVNFTAAIVVNLVESGITTIVNGTTARKVSKSIVVIVDNILDVPKDSVKQESASRISLAVEKFFKAVPLTANGTYRQVEDNIGVVVNCPNTQTNESVQANLKNGILNVDISGPAYMTNDSACDLISTFETGLDGYTQDNTENFDWTRDQGGTPSADTGPVMDHTLETTSGSYMFIETSSPSRTGDRARLISPLYSPQNAGGKLDFWYHMFGSSVGTLNVFVRPQGEPDRLIFSLSGNQGNQWLNSGVLTIGSEPFPFNLVFEGVAGASFTGDIAIDDIQFTNGAVGHACVILLAEINIPSTAIQRAANIPSASKPPCPSARTSYVYYQVTSLFQDLHLLDENQELASGVMLGQVGSTSLTNLADPVLLTFNIIRKPTTRKVSGYNCAFWNYSLGNGVGGWSTEGCALVKPVAGDIVECQCSHLTNFACIVSYRPVSTKKALSVVTYIGCGLSLLGLLVTVISSLSFKALRQSNHQRLMVGVCVTLILLLIFFLLGMERKILSLSDQACYAMALIQHYLLLCTFAWTSAVATLLHSRLVAVFSNFSTSRLRKLVAATLGLPFVIVAITAGSTQVNVYTTDQFCWLNNIYAFVGAVYVPLAISLTYNTTILVLIIRSLRNRRGVSRSSTSPDESNVLNLARVTVILSFLLGLTWSFSILVILLDHIALEYIFAILNTLQGLFIFLLHTVRSPDVRAEWSKTITTLTRSSRPYSTDKQSSKPSKTLSGNARKQQLDESILLQNMASDSIRLTDDDLCSN